MMMRASHLIRCPTVVNEGVERVADVLVEDGVIVDVGEGLDANGAEVVDATGLVLLPGLIDDQVHFREPGLTHKGCIATESAAAVKGGVTSYLEMPNTNPATIDGEALAGKLALAGRDSVANYGFYLGATGHNNEQVARARELGACGVKVFLGASTGNLLVDDQKLLEEVFASMPRDMVLAAHCEDAPRIAERQSEILQEHGGDVPMSMHPVIRDVKACVDSTARAIELARRHSTRLHVLHLSCAEVVKLFEPGDIAGKSVTSEACVHHLWFCAEHYQTLGARIKCNPAIQQAGDRAALRAALREGVIDVVATDHAPHLLHEKEGPYPDVEAGLPLVEHSLLVLLELVRLGELSLCDVARLGSHNPARLFGIKGRGFIKPGQSADLVAVDLEGVTRPEDRTAAGRCGWTPFAGATFSSRIEHVWVNGQHVIKHGRPDRTARGSALTFEGGGRLAA